MVSLKNIITNVLQSHGFDAFEKDGIIYGEKSDSMVCVGIFDRITVAEIREFAKRIADFKGAKIICVLEAGDMAAEEASRLGLILWKKSDLEAEIGRALQSHMKGDENAIFRGLVEPPAREVPEKAPIIIEALGNEDRPFVLKSILNIEDVKEISKNTIDGFKHELELVPHYLFRYSCKYEGKEGKEVECQGIISVNALTGKYGTWDAEPEADPEMSHRVQLEPKIDEENARKIAIHAITSLNTEFKEIIVERDHATIIEKATFKPEKDAIDISSQALVMVPVWCVEGKHGVMILDGITGKIISEDYYESH